MKQYKIILDGICLAVVESRDEMEKIISKINFDSREEVVADDLVVIILHSDWE